MATNIQISETVWEELNQRKKPGDSFDDVLRRELDLGGGDRPDAESLIERFRDSLGDGPPKKAHGQAAVVDTFEILLAQGPVGTSEIQKLVYERNAEHYDSARSMWQSISRYFGDEIPAIESVGYGQWDATTEDL
jgi:hypothetical protein